LELANSYRDYGQPAQGEMHETVTDIRVGKEHIFRSQGFNAERDSFPYADGRFDLVLCCELLEHLIMDPSHMLREIHRVLRPGDYLLLTTPNQVQLDHAISLLRGQNTAYRYSGYGVYGRHNREYTPHEVDQLLRLHNLVPQRIHVENVYQEHSFLHRWLTGWGPLRWRGDTIFALARSSGSPTRVYPDWLYSEMWSRRQITCGSIIMGDGDVFQLGTGWHELEDWPPKIRWTGREAVAFLKPCAAETMLGLRALTGPTGARGEVTVQGLPVGAFSLPPGHEQELLFTLPRDVHTGIAAGTLPELEIHLCVETPFVPAQVIAGATDQRELGIAVTSLWLAADKTR
jgi:hypothetical protein